MTKTSPSPSACDFNDGLIIRYHVKASFVIELALDRPLGNIRRALGENIDNLIEAAGGIETFLDTADLIGVSDCQDRLLATNFSEFNTVTGGTPQLFSAAPDMLVALKTCLRMIEGEDLDEAHGEVADLVRDAIERAEKI